MPSKYNKNEKLCAELVAAIRNAPGGWLMIHHPLVVTLYPAPHAMLNGMLQHKKKAVVQAVTKKDWNSYIFLHERPYRVKAFQQIVKKLDDKNYWSLLGEIWTDSENIRQHLGWWKKVLWSPRPQRDFMMEPAERKFLRSLPKTLAVYRGCTQKHIEGLSWTLDKKLAVGFANRFAGLAEKVGIAHLVSGTCKKDDVIAFFNCREEREIVIDPRRVIGKTVERLA